MPLWFGGVIIIKSFIINSLTIASPCGWRTAADGGLEWLCIHCSHTLCEVPCALKPLPSSFLSAQAHAVLACAP
jgi:hypothetical protein